MELITIGVITNTHGLKGTLKVKSFTDFKNERYKKGNTLYIAFKDELIPVTVTKFRSVKTIEHIDFDEFTNINQVEKYKGSDLRINADQKHDLPEDEFYFDELVGMEVYTNELIGKVQSVREVPQGELLEVDTGHKKKALIPFNKHFIKEVNKQENRITLLEWEGLI
ncbi:Ribosome maturation factor RimM [Candidatus Izimaplasma bacterium HR1]|jgi:16S rRNA processing protein RimM|uniref:ribosome maturation factor RimM n=1 Tax=Candidatus Izimoplasma sp. HR1 TaxID=1541959 RepID=UPI0004F8CA4B|nr:Ribosome maturation factor RimM [Candidatus Izimaplasma bacterium HR1]